MTGETTEESKKLKHAKNRSKKTDKNSPRSKEIDKTTSFKLKHKHNKEKSKSSALDVVGNENTISDEIDEKHMDASQDRSSKYDPSTPKSPKSSGANQVKGDAKKPNQYIKKVRTGPKPQKPMPETNEEDELSESDEEEDEQGVLLTAEIDKGINDVLHMIQNEPSELMKTERAFFPDVESIEIVDTAHNGAEKEKPLYFKDYHRQNILSGDILKDAERPDEEAGPSPETYNETQARQRAEILTAINEEMSRAANEEDDLLMISTKPREEEEEVKLPDPEDDGEAFLRAFLDTKAWVPKNGKAWSKDKKVLDLPDLNFEEDSDSFNELADKVESSYNFRFEDPNAASIVSYARGESSMRRKKLSARQRARQRKHEEALEEQKQKKQKMDDLRKKKVAEVTEKLMKLRYAAGDDDILNKITNEDLEADFDAADWDRRMQNLFDDEYYSKTDAEWKQPDALDNELWEAVAREQESGVQLPKSKKEIKQFAKMFVAKNADLLYDEAYNPSSDFKYTQVEPESFGLSAKDILLADDKQLNRYVSLKKLAPYRDAFKRAKDKKRYESGELLKQWRKRTFGNPQGPDDHLWESIERGGRSEHKSKKRRKH